MRESKKQTINSLSYFYQLKFINNNLDVLRNVFLMKYLENGDVLR